MTLKQFWHKISFIGLEDHEEFSHREVVLLNKLVFIASAVIVPVIPLEVILNGWELVPYELIIFASSFITLFFNYKRWHQFAKIYFFFVAIGYIYFMGLAVGYGSGNDLAMICVFVAPLMLLNDLKSIIILSLIAAIAFISLRFAQESVEPMFDIDMKLKRRFYIIFQAITLIILFFQVYYFKNINFKFQALVLKKNELIEEKNKEIVDSINYAQRIQSTYLPPKKVLSLFFEKSFLLFEPKDIVSGDFYWFYNEQIGEDWSDEKFIVAADCTGHGVPGAIMSVICANALNDVVVTRGERETGKILDLVRENVVRILKGKDEHEGRKDGMDLAMVRINKKTGECQYSGAHNPLWILRKGTTEFEIIKADKQPVGQFENATPFSTHTIQLNSGDRIYLFSDGLQDQFGGEKGKKFKASNMKTLFLDLKHKEMSEHKDAVRKAFIDWKGDLEQVDDLVLIGIEF